MRRSEKEITVGAEIEAVIQKALVCRLGLVDGDRPYIVPLCFGYRDRTIYVHSSPVGRKIDILRKNNNICFEFDINTGVAAADSACGWSMKYQSVIGFGTASFVDSLREKREALNIIMNQYTGGTFQFPDTALAKTSVIKIAITGLTGKQSP